MGGFSATFERLLAELEKMPGVGPQRTDFHVVPFFRWPDQGRLAKEYERTRARKR
jgi:recombinational DNA repair protein RecR